MTTETKKIFKLSEKFLEQYEGKQPNWGFGDLSYFVYKRTYSRLKEDGTQEEYFDTVKRVVEGCFQIQIDHCAKFGLPWDAMRAQKSAQKMFDKIWKFKFTPPGRGFWVMGTPVVEKIGSAALQNCGFRSTKDIKKDLAAPFTWACDMLMLGVGVGFDTRGAGTVVIKKPKGNPVTYQIPDSREGWVESVKLLINSYQGGNPVQFDYSLIRPAGQPIKGFGGTSSGHKPLEEGHENIRTLLDKNDDEPISSVVIVDIMNFIGKFVVSGNVRRSAEICLGDASDKEYITMKDPIKYKSELWDRRWASNNSVFADDVQDYSSIITGIAKNGEPGLMYINNANHYGRMIDGYYALGSDKYDECIGVNPCKPLNSLILTPEGYITFEQALYKDNLIVIDREGKPHKASKPFKTGEDKTVYRILLSNGAYIYGTGNHKHKDAYDNWIKLEDFSIGDKLEYNIPQIYTEIIPNTESDDYKLGTFCGWVQGDGWFYNRSDSTGHNVGLCFGNHEFDTIKYFEDTFELKTKEHAQKPNTCRVFNSHNTKYSQMLLRAGMQPGKESLEWLYTKSKDFKIGFIRAIFTADGSVRKHNNCELYSINRKSLEVLQNILLELGIVSTICIHNYEKSYIASDGKVRNNSDTYKLNVYGGQFKKIGFISKFKNDLLDKQVETKLRKSNSTEVTIIDIEPEYSVEDVYDITVYSDEHLFVDTGIGTHNCAEILLCDGELCNLVETYPANHIDAEEYLDTLKYAYLYAKTVTLLPTHDPLANSVMLRNRRIGVSQSGIQQALSRFGTKVYFEEFCNKGYQELRRWDKTYSRWLGIPTSIRVSTVKPSGTVSLLAGATPGVHCTHSAVYYRTIRVAGNDPLIHNLLKAGYRIESAMKNGKCEIITDENLSQFSDQTLVVYFAVVEKGYTKSKYDITLWEQMTLVRELQHYWADNSVSCTITFKPEEVRDLESAIKFFAPHVKTLSFLPLDNHSYDQAPYQTITIEEADKYYKGLKTLKMNRTKKTDIAGDKFCTNDSCSI